MATGVKVSTVQAVHSNGIPRAFVEAAFAVNKLIKPKTVIPTHANQVSTTGGAVNPGTRLELFINEVKKVDVIVPLSGVPISCNGAGKYTQGP